MSSTLACSTKMNPYISEHACICDVIIIESRIAEQKSCEVCEEQGGDPSSQSSTLRILGSAMDVNLPTVYHTSLSYT